MTDDGKNVINVKAFNILMKTTSKNFRNHKTPYSHTCKILD